VNIGVTRNALKQKTEVGLGPTTRDSDFTDLVYMAGATFGVLKILQLILMYSPF
jgi:hypothetical protein